MNKRESLNESSLMEVYKHILVHGSIRANSSRFFDPVRKAYMYRVGVFDKYGWDYWPFYQELSDEP